MASVILGGGCSLFVLALSLGSMSADVLVVVVGWITNLVGCRASQRAKGALNSTSGRVDVGLEGGGLVAVRHVVWSISSCRTIKWLWFAGVSRWSETR